MKLIRDPKRRQLMGRSARAWILEHYVESRVVGMTVDYYKGFSMPGLLPPCKAPEGAALSPSLPRRQTAGLHFARPRRPCPLPPRGPD